ncbi:MAG: hypothetical protein KAV87_04895, partial [Desulfobacteraceae bacterium]|nr:hypothetical protein [Desulfobacteraceae bacterium]
RIKTVEYKIESKVGTYFQTSGSEKITRRECRFWKKSRKTQSSWNSPKYNKHTIIDIIILG